MNAFNFTTMTEYSGQNAAIVGNGTLPAFASFNQLKSLGYMVNKGAKGIKVFCGYKPKKDAENGKKVPVYGVVFDIVDTTAAQDKDFLKWLKAEIKAGRIKKAFIG